MTNQYPFTYNSPDPPPRLGSWMEVWREAKRNNLHNTPEFVLSYTENDPNNSLTFIRRCWHYTPEYVKQKAFDEIESMEPLRWDRETIGQAFHCASVLSEVYHCDKVADWLSKIAVKERRKIYEDERNRKG